MDSRVYQFPIKDKKYNPVINPSVHILTLGLEITRSMTWPRLTSTTKMSDLALHICYCLQSQLVTTWWFLFPSRLMENWGKKMRLKFPSWRHVTSREVLCSPLRPLGQSYNATCQVPLNTTHTLHTISEENTFLTNQFSDIDVHMDEWWWTF